MRVGSQYRSTFLQRSEAEALYNPLPEAMPGQTVEQQIVAMITVRPMRLIELRKRLGLSQRALYNLLEPMREQHLVQGGSYAEIASYAGDDTLRLGPAFAITPGPDCGELLVELVLRALTPRCGHTRLSLAQTTRLSSSNVQQALRRLRWLGVVRVAWVGALAIYHPCPASSWLLERSSSTRELDILKAAAVNHPEAPCDT